MSRPPHGDPSPVSAVEEVRRAAEVLVAAFGRGDLDEYFACFADDATFLFPTTGELLPSTQAYRREWSSWQEETGFAVLGCTTTGTDVRVHGDAAVLTHRVRTTTSERGVVSELDERETIVFCRQDDGRWLAVHEHLSAVPATV